MMDGLSKTAMRKTVAEYSAMASMGKAAFNMAKAAWRYEKSILTGDSARFLDEYNTIPKKYGGGVLRFFPRALLATDAFFENIHYRGYVVGNATGEALEAGVAKGLKEQHSSDKVWVFLGDMAFESGIFYEVHKYARNYDLPLHFVVEDNGVSTNTPTLDTWNGKQREIPEDVIYYKYESKYPHYGTGKWVVF
jgi:hypothetical protein